jgi:hypothetical protein
VESFEGESFTSCWEPLPSADGGRIRTVTEYGPLHGERHLLMDASPGGSRRIQELVLHIAGATAVRSKLVMHMKGLNAEWHTLPGAFVGRAAGDGVSISIDGARWYSLPSVLLQNGAYQCSTIDLGAEVKKVTAGQPVDVRIKIQQDDDQPAPSDGLLLDYVVIADNISYDANSDNLPDWWAMAHFGNTDQRADDDTDRDGRTNADEYADGTDPNDGTNTLGLVACYAFDGDAQDASGYGNHAAVNGPVPALDRYNNPAGAYAFDGANDIISKADFNLQYSQLSMAAWVKLDNWGSAASRHILSIENGIYSVQLEALANGEIRWDSRGDGDLYRCISPAGAIKTGQWTHVAATWGDGIAKIYINGLLVATQSVAPMTVSVIDRPLRIGTGNPAENGWWLGTMDDVRIYSRSLDSNEVARLYTNTLPNLAPPGTFERWLSDQGITNGSAEHFHQDHNTNGVPNGLEYAFGSNLPTDGQLLKIRNVNGRRVIETPVQDPATQPYLYLQVLGSTDLVHWSLMVVPAADTTGMPANRLWYETAGPPLQQAFFKLEAKLRNAGDGSFDQWLSAHGLSGTAVTLFQQDRNGDNVSNGLEYVFGADLPTDGPLLKIRSVNGRTVLEIPVQDAATLPYVNLRVLGSTDLVHWSLGVIPAADTTGMPANRIWYQPVGPPLQRAFFKLEADLK